MLGNAVSNFIQGRPPNAPSDEGTGGDNQNIIQSIGQNIGNAIQTFNPFRPQQGGQNPVQAGKWGNW